MSLGHEDDDRAATSWSSSQGYCVGASSLKTRVSSPLPPISDMAQGICRSHEGPCEGVGVLGYAGGLDVITAVLKYTAGSRRVRIREGSLGMGGEGVCSGEATSRGMRAASFSPEAAKGERTPSPLEPPESTALLTQGSSSVTHVGLLSPPPL